VGCVSVITTAYNVAPFIGSAIHSILAQTHWDWELIVVDDGSADGTRDVVATFTDSRIRLMAGTRRGPVGALNAGLAEARGEFVAFLDGDDAWAPSNLERQLVAMRQRPGCEMTFSLSRMIDADGKDLGPMSKTPRGPVTRADLFVENFCANGSSVLLRRSAVERAGEFDEAFPGCYDLDYWMRVAGESGEVICVPEALIFYRRRHGQMSANWQRMEEGWRALVAKWERLAPQMVRDGRARAEMNMYRYLAAVALEAGEVRNAAVLLATACRAEPFAFWGESRNYLVAGALPARLLLPAAWYVQLERRARLARG
jgi:glycosyltransferase involved in cell wall biosynthesis